MARKRAENREGSLGFPGFVKPVFTKDSKPLGRRKRSLGHLGSVKPVHSEGSVLQDLKFVDVGFGRTSPDLACVGQYWLEVLQVDLSFLLLRERLEFLFSSGSSFISVFLNLQVIFERWFLKLSLYSLG
ncbi:hypothetical protein TNCV_1806001 [Trichonephila clavipes]|nr:hypothetical protein TNCV_1806001 [Trichonephila clavipes]